MPHLKARLGCWLLSAAFAKASQVVWPRVWGYGVRGLVAVRLVAIGAGLQRVFDLPGIARLEVRPCNSQFADQRLSGSFLCSTHCLSKGKWGRRRD